MSHFLTDYQIAVLQEMGVPVWQDQASARSEQPATATKTNATEATPHKTPASKEQRTARLAQLRSSLSGDSKAPATTEAAQSGPAADSVTALTPEQLRQAQTWLKDLERVLKEFKLLAEQASPQWHWGGAFSVDQAKVVLPFHSTAPQMSEKRRLWQAIRQTAKP